MAKMQRFFARSFQISHQVNSKATPINITINWNLEGEWLALQEQEVSWICSLAKLELGEDF